MHDTLQAVYRPAFAQPALCHADKVATGIGPGWILTETAQN
jgi:hypothetical protein